MPLESHLFCLVAFFERDSNGTLIPIPWKKSVLLRRSSASRSLDIYTCQDAVTLSHNCRKAVSPSTQPKSRWWRLLPDVAFTPIEVYQDLNHSGRPSSSSSRMCQPIQGSKPSQANSRTRFSQQVSNWGGFLTPKTRWRTRSGEVGTTSLQHLWTVMDGHDVLPRFRLYMLQIDAAISQACFLSSYFYALIDCIVAGREICCLKGSLTIMSLSNTLNHMRVESPNIEQCRHVSRNRVVDGSGVGTSSFRLLYYFAET